MKQIFIILCLLKLTSPAPTSNLEYKGALGWRIGNLFSRTSLGNLKSHYHRNLSREGKSPSIQISTGVKFSESDPDRSDNKRSPNLSSKESPLSPKSIQYQSEELDRRFPSEESNTNVFHNPSQNILSDESPWNTHIPQSYANNLDYDSPYPSSYPITRPRVYQHQLRYPFYNQYSPMEQYMSHYFVPAFLPYDPLTQIANSYAWKSFRNPWYSSSLQPKRREKDYLRQNDLYKSRVDAKPNYFDLVERVRGLIESYHTLKNKIMLDSIISDAGSNQHDKHRRKLYHVISTIKKLQKLLAEGISYDDVRGRASNSGEYCEDHSDLVSDDEYANIIPSKSYRGSQEDAKIVNQAQGKQERPRQSSENKDNSHEFSDFRSKSKTEISSNNTTQQAIANLSELHNVVSKTNDRLKNEKSTQ